MSIKIMGIDTSPTIMRLLKLSIKQHVKDCEFFEAEESHIALDILEYHSDMALIFLDMDMPDITAKEFLLNIKSQKRYKDVKVIAQVTKSNIDEAKSLQDFGINGYIVKPYTLENLQDLLADLSSKMNFEML